MAFAATTCFLTSDHHWIRLDELAQHPFVQVWGWREGKFRLNYKPYTIEPIPDEMPCYMLTNAYRINLVATYYHHVPTPRGFVAYRALTGDDELYMYWDGKMAKTRPQKRKALGRRAVYKARFPDLQAVVARDMNSQWKYAYNFGILTIDSRSSTRKAQTVIKRALGKKRNHKPLGERK